MPPRTQCDPSWESALGARKLLRPDSEVPQLNPGGFAIQAGSSALDAPELRTPKLESFRTQTR
eukprot:6370645-Alexandrium_andersonii.AAC.1